MTQTNVLQLLGLAYTVTGLGLLFHPKYYRAMLQEYLKSSPVMFLNGCIVLAIGYLMVSNTNPNESGISLIITVIGWLALVKGIGIILFPQFHMAVTRKLKLPYITSEAIMVVLLGLALLYLGFA